MSVFDEQLKGLSPGEREAARMLVEVSKTLYREAEAQLLEGFSHTAGRPRDGFDALVMVCTLARAIQSLAVGSVDLGPETEKERALLLPTIFTIGGVLGHGLIHVSPHFPFTAEEMTTATTPHIISGSAACSLAVDEAIERISPMMLDIAAHFAASYPEEHKTLARLIVGDVGTIH